MSKQTKLILTVLGLCAIIIPVILLLTITNKTPPTVQVPAGERDINEGNIQETAAKTVPDLVLQPTELPSTGSAIFGTFSPSPSPGT